MTLASADGALETGWSGNI